MFSVGNQGMNFVSDDEGLYPVAIDLSEVLYLGTQQSSNFQNKSKGKICVDVISDDEEENIVEEEVVLVKKLKRQ